AAEGGHRGGVEEGGEEWSDQRGAGDEDHRAAEGIEAGGSIAEPAHVKGGDERLAAVGGEQGEDEAGRPGGQLRGQVRGKRREQVDPPAPSWRQQQGRRQDRVWGPDHRRSRGW